MSRSEPVRRRNRMKRQEGFALIASLLVLLVLAIMGLGSIFLTQINLRIAENSRTGAIARFNAEAGLDSAFVVLAGAFRESTSVPSDIDEFRTLFPDFEGGSFAFANSNGYTV